MHNVWLVTVYAEYNDRVKQASFEFNNMIDVTRFILTYQTDKMKKYKPFKYDVEQIPKLF